MEMEAHSLKPKVGYEWVSVKSVKSVGYEIGQLEIVVRLPKPTVWWNVSES